MNTQTNERSERTNTEQLQPSSSTIGHVCTDIIGWNGTISVCGRDMQVEISIDQYYASRGFPFTVQDVEDSLERVLAEYEHIFDESMFPDTLFIRMKDQPAFRSSRSAYGEFHKSQSKRRARTGSRMAISLYTMRYAERKTKNGQGRFVTWYTNDGERIEPMETEVWERYLDGLIAHELGHGFDFFVRGGRKQRRSALIPPDCQATISTRDVVWPDDKAESVANGCVKIIDGDYTFPWYDTAFSMGWPCDLHDAWDETAFAHSQRVWAKGMGMGGI